MLDKPIPNSVDIVDNFEGEEKVRLIYLLNIF